MLNLPDKDKVNRLGIMGGTFDPVHLGHLVTAEEVRIQYGLDHVIFVPSGQPPHKDNRKVSDSEHRYMMTMLATITNPYFTVSRVEIDQHPSALTYTIDTVRYFHDHFGPKIKLFFITGADAILEIITWKDYRELLKTCTFIAATRPGYSLDKLKETLGAVCPETLPNIHLLAIPAVAVSSTMIRRRVSEGKTIKYLTPESVTEYIIKNRLYLQHDE